MAHSSALHFRLRGSHPPPLACGRTSVVPFQEPVMGIVVELYYHLLECILGGNMSIGASIFNLGQCCPGDIREVTDFNGLNAIS